MTPIFSFKINLNITAINDGAIMIGTNIKENRILLPGKTLSNNIANANPNISSKVVATNAKINVNRIEFQKFGSERRFR